VKHINNALIQVKKALRARGKQPDPQAQPAEAQPAEAQPAEAQPAEIDQSSAPKAEPVAKAKAKARGRKKTAKATGTPQEDGKVPAETSTAAEHSPCKPKADGKRKVVQSPNKPSPNQKAPKQRQRAPRTTDDAEELKRMWAEQD
jgi:hypothetical protein